MYIDNSDFDYRERLSMLQHARSPKDETEFYLQSFRLFSKLEHHCSTSSLGQSPENIIWEYSNLCRVYDPKSQWAKIWDLCYALYFTENEEFYDTLSEWLNEHRPNDSLECHTIRGNWSQLLDIIPPEEASLRQAIKQRENNYQGHLDIQTLNAAYQRVSHILSGVCDYHDLSLADQVLATARFSRPGIPRYELFALAQRMQQGSDEVEDYLWMGMVDHALAKSDDLWLQTHLGFTLVTLDVKTSTSFPIENGFSLVDPIYFSMYDYAKTISAKGLWKEAVGYLCTCSENRQLWIRELLDKPEFKVLPVEYINGVLNVAVQFALSEIEDFLHLTIGKIYEDSGSIRLAAIEYSKASSREDVERLAEMGLEQYLKKGLLDEVVEDPDQVKISPQYTFLSLYQKFRVLLSQYKFEEASKLFLHLLTLEIPSQFDAVLLVDNYSILEDNGVYYSFSNFLNFINLFKTIQPKRRFVCEYFNQSRSESLPVELIWIKLRERLSFKASISQT